MQKKPKSPFVTFFTTAIMAILLLSVTFTFVMFKTDTFMAVDTSKLSLSPVRPAEVVSVSVLKETVEEDESSENESYSPNLPGIDTPSSSLNMSSEALRVESILRDEGTFAAKATAMAAAYQVLVVDLDLKFELAIAVMANIAHEGNLSIVEYSFSDNGAHGFKLPSGGVKAMDMYDLEYLASWDSSSTEKGNYGVKKGSCGFGCVQWSFGRRVALVDIYKSLMGGQTAIPDSVRLTSEVTMIGNELRPGTQYYDTVSRMANANKLGEKQGTLVAWVEAVVDYYVMPSGCCSSDTKMTTAGKACQTRVNTALQLYDILYGKIN